MRFIASCPVIRRKYFRTKKKVTDKKVIIISSNQQDSINRPPFVPTSELCAQAASPLRIIRACSCTGTCTCISNHTARATSLQAWRQIDRTDPFPDATPLASLTPFSGRSPDIRVAFDNFPDVLPCTLSLRGTEDVSQDVVSQLANTNVRFGGASVFFQGRLCGEAIQCCRHQRRYLGSGLLMSNQFASAIQKTQPQSDQCNHGLSMF